MSKNKNPIEVEIVLDICPKRETMSKTSKAIKMKVTKPDEEICDAVSSVKQIVTESKEKLKEKTTKIDNYKKIIHRLKSIQSIQQDFGLLPNDASNKLVPNTGSNELVTESEFYNKQILSYEEEISKLKKELGHYSKRVQKHEDLIKELYNDLITPIPTCPICLEYRINIALKCGHCYCDNCVKVPNYNCQLCNVSSDVIKLFV
eukprot:Pompholyxophrys_sp_v1_NODE_5_length_12280_cov_3.373988.p7 type:complete len:204 gc:universal NODE_5_length_12280_cov_3.373988:1638-2249(+)